MRTLSACVVCRDEGPYILEWLCYHKILGIEHFYVYNNLSSDETREMVSRFASDNSVDIIDWDMHPGYLQAYDDCFKRSQTETTWLAVIDVDEFIFLTDPDVTLQHLLMQYNDYSALALSAYIFGSSGYVSKDNALVIERFNKHHDPSAWDYRFIKSIVKPSDVIDFKNPHYFNTKQGTTNEHNQLVDASQRGISNIPPSYDFVYFHHYIIKSRQEYFDKKSKRGDALGSRNYNDNFFKHHDRNNIHSTLIHRYIPEVKLLMEKYSG